MTTSDQPHDSSQPRLPGLSATDTRWLLRESQRVLAGLGQETSVVDGTHLETEAGLTVGLDNLARTLHLLPRKKWERAVREQLTTLVRLDVTGEVEVEALRAKLWPRERADGLLEYEPLATLPGFVGVLAAQRDGATVEFGRLDQLAEGRDASYAVALRNLSSLRLPRHSRRRVDQHNPSSWVEFLDGGDSFGAARVLVLPDIIRRVLRQEFPQDGVLVAIPTKYELWLHVPVDETVLEIGARMAWLAHEVWSREPYALSPNVFLVSPDMQAVDLVVPGDKGFDVNQEPALRLLAAFPGEQREAS